MSLKAGNCRIGTKWYVFLTSFQLWLMIGIIYVGIGIISRLFIDVSHYASYTSNVSKGILIAHKKRLKLNKITRDWKSLSFILIMYGILACN